MERGADTIVISSWRLWDDADTKGGKSSVKITSAIANFKY
jgi:hypothetical protein